MTEQELIEQARKQAATNFSRWLGLFWRQGKNGLEVCRVEENRLGNWQSDWRTKPSESSERI